MQRNFKLILSIVVVLLAGALAFGQEKKIEYKDVTLDGKPAKLNVATGEITFVNPNDKKKPVKFDDFVAESEKAPRVLTSKKAITHVKEESDLDSDYYTVKEGETLLEIANRFGTSLTELKRVNNLETTLVDKGQKLKVKNFNAKDFTLPNSEVKVVYENTSGFHVVEKGQTLYGLAKRYGTTVNQLKQQNGLTSDIIKIGQRLQIGNSDSVEELGHVSVWTVSKGDTLYSIAKKNGVTVEHIKNLNGLESNLIKIGQKLQLK